MNRTRSGAAPARKIYRCSIFMLQCVLPELKLMTMTTTQTNPGAETMELTHTVDPDTGHYVQIVTPTKPRCLLRSIQQMNADGFGDGFGSGFGYGDGDGVGDGSGFGDGRG